MLTEDDQEKASPPATPGSSRTALGQVHINTPGHNSPERETEQGRRFPASTFGTLPVTDTVCGGGTLPVTDTVCGGVVPSLSLTQCVGGGTLPVTDTVCGGVVPSLSLTQCVGGWYPPCH